MKNNKGIACPKRKKHACAHTHAHTHKGICRFILLKSVFTACNSNYSNFPFLFHKYEALTFYVEITSCYNYYSFPSILEYDFNNF